mmetsp:Transcript_14496/g.41697  ORF Transcript_14496/g.41697 Transcript_14496/m.41697 type:complete len:101 (-) Transcript_14496:1075-1377(-)
MSLPSLATDTSSLSLAKASSYGTMATSISVRILASISAKSLLLFAVFRRAILVGGDCMDDSDFGGQVLLYVASFLLFLGPRGHRDKDTGSDEKLAREALE